MEEGERFPPPTPLPLPPSWGVDGRWRGAGEVDPPVLLRSLSPPCPPCSDERPARPERPPGGGKLLVTRSAALCRGN